MVYGMYQALKMGESHCEIPRRSDRGKINNLESPVYNKVAQNCRHRVFS
jgi:hypothetical protein